MSEIERRRDFADGCLDVAKRMSVLADAARLREMAEEALAKAASLERLRPHPQAQLQQQPQAQQQQQPQLPNDDPPKE